jgi:integrase
MAKAGLRGISLHALRHGHASQLLSDGVPIPTISKRLGHTNPTITLNLYSHALDSDELAAAQRWEQAFAMMSRFTPTPLMVHKRKV